MSYLRGRIYCWASDAGMHIWSAINSDSEFARVSGWAATYGAENVSSVCLAHKTFDELVVMRHAEMTEREREKAEKRACRKWHGNIGCDALLKRRGLPGFAARVAARTVEGE